MTSKFLMAAATVSLMLGASVIAAHAQPKAPKLTHSVAVALTDVQKAIAAKDYPTALKGPQPNRPRPNN